jgi:hypothetical protein
MKPLRVVVPLVLWIVIASTASAAPPKHPPKKHVKTCGLYVTYSC